MMADDWELVQSSRGRETLRLEVPGGWLYLVNALAPNGAVAAQGSMVFVPADPLMQRITDEMSWAEAAAIIVLAALAGGGGALLVSLAVGSWPSCP
jgi:hypothetical protein